MTLFMELDRAGAGMVCVCAIAGLLLGRFLWTVARCYDALCRMLAADAAPDANLLRCALKAAVVQSSARMHMRLPPSAHSSTRSATPPAENAGADNQPAWFAAIPATTLAAIYALLTARGIASALTPASVLGLAWAVTLLMLLALIDARTSFLPDALTLPLLWSGLALALPGVNRVAPSDALAAVMLAWVALWLLATLFLLLRGRDGLGGGDIKLLAAIGAWAGAPDVFLVLLYASISGLAYALIVALMTARGQSMGELRVRQHPFGPHLAIAAIVLLLWRTL